MKTGRTIEDQLRLIREAYDRTVEDHAKGLEEESFLPEAFKKSSEYVRFKGAEHACHSGDPRIRDFLDPGTDMRFLDVGSCANLLGYRLHEWSSLYFGVDISPRLIAVVQDFVRSHDITIGGLHTAEAARLPFEYKFFDIAACIGVLEYYDTDYIGRSLTEIRRVLKSGGRFVVDMPNQDHSDFETMIRLEEFLGRPRFHLPSRKAFEDRLHEDFEIAGIDDAGLMILYSAIRRG